LHVAQFGIDRQGPRNPGPADLSRTERRASGIGRRGRSLFLRIEWRRLSAAETAYTQAAPCPPNALCVADRRRFAPVVRVGWSGLFKGGLCRAAAVTVAFIALH